MDSKSSMLSFDLMPPQASFSRNIQVIKGSELGRKKRWHEFWYIDLLVLQRADGSFLLGKDLADWAGPNLKVLQSWARKLAPGGSGAESVLATALALVLLEKKAADASGQWQAAADKARAWLNLHRSTLEGLPVEDWLRQNLK